MRNKRRAPTSKRRAFPDFADNQLEWACRNLLTSAGYANDHALTPALVTRLQSRSHRRNIPDAFEREVASTVCLLRYDLFHCKIVKFVMLETPKCACMHGGKQQTKAIDTDNLTVNGVNSYMAINSYSWQLK